MNYPYPRQQVLIKALVLNGSEFYVRDGHALWLSGSKFSAQSPKL